MSVKELEAILTARELKLALKDGQPIIRGDREKVTPPLMDALKRYRKAIVEYLQKQATEQPI